VPAPDLVLVTDPGADRGAGSEVTARQQGHPYNAVEPPPAQSACPGAGLQATARATVCPAISATVRQLLTSSNRSDWCDAPAWGALTYVSLQDNLSTTLSQGRREHSREGELIPISDLRGRLGPELNAAVSLRTLVRDTSLGLQVVGRTDITDRHVTWVYISELPFPGAWLDGGELVATMGQWLRGGRVTATEYVADIVAAGAGALVFSSGPPVPDLINFREIPAEVIAAADAQGLPLLGMTPETTFLSVSKTVAYLAATDGLGQVTAALDAHELLIREVAGRDGIAGLCQRLGVVLDAWTVVLGPDGEQLGGYSQSRLPRLTPLFEEIRALQRPLGPNVLPLIGGHQPVVAYALRHGPRVHGYLLIGRSRPPTGLERRIINNAVTLIILMLRSRHGAADLNARLRSRYAQELLNGHLQSAAQLAGLIVTAVPTGPLYVLVAHSRLPAGEERQESWRALMDSLGPSLVAADAEHEMAVIDARGIDMEACLRPVLEELTDRTVGLAGPVAPDKLEGAKRTARAALDRANRTGSSLVDARELRSGGLLELLHERQAAHFAMDVLGPLLEARGTTRGDLVATLRTWLAHHGQWDPAAAELGIHRHTLRNRIDRAARILQADLDSAAQRMELWAALELLDRQPDSSSSQPGAAWPNQ
jgi:PucR family transcriptional regulator, purine catabolism regulatory protein